MNGAYEELRREAQAKRDKLIEAARQEYRVALSRIKALHRMVTGEHRAPVEPPKRKRPEALTLLGMLSAALPKDRPFTIADACALMYDNPLTCRYRETSIRGQIRVLMEAGKIRQVERRNGHILWAWAESGIEAPPFGALTLAEIAEQLIGEFGPMRLNEIVARMKEQGFRPDEPNRRTAALMRSAMRKISGRFVKDQAGRWVGTKVASGVPGGANRS